MKGEVVIFCYLLLLLLLKVVLIVVAVVVVVVTVRMLKSGEDEILNEMILKLISIVVELKSISE